MGGSDVYCSLCGGPLQAPWWEIVDREQDSSTDKSDSDESDYEFTHSYESTVIQPESEKMDWLQDVRLIGENPDSTSPEKVYISGLASYYDSGMFNTEPGNDSNFFADRNDAFIRAYSWDCDNPIAIPYHQSCYKLLGKAVGVDELDKEVLYQTLKGFGSTGRFGRSLDLDYGSVLEFHEQYWDVQRGWEHIVFSPTEIPELEEYCQTLPVLGSAVETASTAPKEGSSDIFYRLSPETQLLVVSFLDMPSVYRLRTASRAVYNLELRNSFWRTRLSGDMPWLYDGPQVLSRQRPQSDSLDWVEVYKTLHRASRANNDATIHGLANRRRIWEEILPQITKAYHGRKKKWDVEADRAPPILAQATSTKCPQLVLPEPTNVWSTTHPLVREYWEVSSAAQVLVVEWTDGRLANFSVLGSESQQAVLQAPRTDRVEVPGDDWMSGLVITTQQGFGPGPNDAPRRNILGLEILFAKQHSVQLGVQEGDKRLIHVSENRFAVAIKTDRSSSGLVSRLSLLQQPYNRVYQVERILLHPANAPNLHAMNLLWRKEIPPSPIHAPACDSGYWAHGMQLDVSPMEHLLFGPAEEDLADITALSTDVQFGGIMVTYGNRPNRTIGPRLQALTTLKIDGRGGERLVAIHAVVSHIPSALRFVTNRGRQLVVGHERGRWLLYPPVLDSGSIPVLAGFYGWWSNRETPKTTLSAVGCLFDPTPAYNDASDIPSGPIDPKGLYWDPSPPLSAEEHGRIWGDRVVKGNMMTRAGRRPGEGSIVRWLDCSRPIKTIRVSLCHSTEASQIPLCGISLVYADGDEEEATSGSGVYPLHPTDTEGTNQHHWCWCALGHQESKVKTEMESWPHYQQESWDVDGQRLQSLRMWLAEDDSLAGLQFSTEKGATSPVWTREPGALGEPAGQIEFSGSEEAVGLKLFFDQDDRSVSRNDSVVVAIQAMKRK